MCEDFLGGLRERSLMGECSLVVLRLKAGLQP